MDLLQDKIHKLFFKYFFAAFGSACISCIYGIVDMAVVGQYHGPDGTAAMAVVMPIFNIIYSLGLFVGIGGSVLYSVEKGKADSEEETRNEYFTLACIGGAFFSILVWVILFAFEEPLLYLFGADDILLPLTKQYMTAIRIAAPAFLGTQLFGAFLRNDNAPGLATAAVLITGIFNVFGDFFFVFFLDMGIMGAAKRDRIRQTRKYAVLTSAVFGIIWILLIAGFPNTFVRLFMSPTPEVLEIAPAIMRTYAAVFLLLPFNVFCTYYFQSVMEPKSAFVISLGRGLVVSGATILILPAVFGADALWLAMPITEAAVAVYAVIRMKTVRL